MKIEFVNVVPEPLLNEFSVSSQLWGKHVQFQTLQNSIIDASSGKGKSTFISLLAGIRKDYQGEILYDNKNINLLSKQEWTQIRRTKFAFVFQDLQLFDKLTVRENLLLKNNLTDFKSEKEIIDDLNELGLGNKWDQVCGNLSLGQQQRVAILRSLLQPSEFIIMDEPFSHLDTTNTNIALELIYRHSMKHNSGLILTSLGDQYSIPWDQKIQLA
jgi:putative ABC transport system ATP-binding protein